MRVLPRGLFRLAPGTLLFATPAAAAITTIDFIGIGTITQAAVDCYDNGSQTICPELGDYNLRPVGSRFVVEGRYTHTPGTDFLAEAGFSQAVLSGELAIRLSWFDAPQSAFLFTDELQGPVETLKGIFIRLDLDIGADLCEGFAAGSVTYFGVSPVSGRIGVDGLCGYAEDAANDPMAPYFGFAGDWRMVRSSIDGGPFTPVPEPQSWTMLIAGFGLVGATLRRRSQPAAR